MAEQKLCKNDIAAVFKRLRGIPSNKVCFDCGAKNPTWASVTYGVFICIDCSAVHRSLGVHLSFVRSTQLDTNWTWLQLRAMQVGGNSNAVSFFQQHGCSSKDSQQKYNSRAAQLYREKLHQQAASAIRLHGTKLHIDIPHLEPPHSPEHRDIDFFKDITEAQIFSENSRPTVGDENKNGSLVENLNSSPNVDRKDDPAICKKLEISLGMPLSEAQKQMEVRKANLTSRKPAGNKKGMGGKKGLGAQKVQTNFNDIEREAQKVDELREQTHSSETKNVMPLSNEDEEKQRASIRLAYKDLSIRQKETEEKLRQTDPRKADQLERLGMCFGGGGNRSSGSVTHSAASEMKLIAQENTTPPPKSRDLDLDDDFEFFAFSSGPPKYGDSPFLSRSSSDRLGDFSGKGSWSQEKPEKKSPIEMMPHKDTSGSGRSRKPIPALSPANADEAQKKFGNAKAISSEQFFGPSRDSEFERRANLSRFEGSNSISSEDYFCAGDSPSQRAMSSSFSGPNLYDIKEGVRDGVTKVAGRLSSIANGVMSSLQRK